MLEDGASEQTAAVRIDMRSCFPPPFSLPFTTTSTPTLQNAYSNKRWCCNDQTHFDVSVWAWEKLADKKWGVIGACCRAACCPLLLPCAPLPGPPFLSVCLSLLAVLAASAACLACQTHFLNPTPHNTHKHTQ